MGEGKTDGFIHKITGASANDWKRRAETFIREPRRREEMMQRLIGTFSAILNKENQNPLFYKESIDTALTGVETHFVFPKENSEREWMGLCLLPKNTVFQELPVTSDTHHEEEFGSDIARNLAEQDPSNIYLLTTPPARVWKHNASEPINGMARGGTIEKKFVNKNPSSPQGVFDIDGLVRVISRGLKNAPQNRFESNTQFANELIATFYDPNIK